MLKNPRHEAFAVRMARGEGNRAAYMAVYPNAKPIAADASAAKLLNRLEVRARIDGLMAAAAEKAGVTIERIVAEFARIGFADPRRVVSWDGTAVLVRNSADLSDDDAAAIAEVGKTREGVKIKLHDKVSALEKLGRHLGMFKDKLEVAGANGGPVQVEMAPNELMRRLAFLLTKPKESA